LIKAFEQRRRRLLAAAHRKDFARAVPQDAGVMSSLRKHINTASVDTVCVSDVFWHMSHSTCGNYSLLFKHVFPTLKVQGVNPLTASQMLLYMLLAASMPIAQIEGTQRNTLPESTYFDTSFAYHACCTQVK